MMNLAGAKRDDGRAWSWRDVFPPRGHASAKSTPIHAPAPTRKAQSPHVMRALFAAWAGKKKAPKPD